MEWALKLNAAAVLRGWIAFALVGMIVACGGQGTAPASTSQPSVAASAATATAAPSQDALNALYAAAKAEGSVNIFAQADPQYMSALFAAFKARYPGIEPNYVQKSNEESTQLLLVAVSAGQKPPADVVLSKFQALRPLYDRGSIDVTIDWAAYGVPAKVLLSIKGAVVELTQPYGLAYNTNLVRPDELPTTWEKLVDPKWRGKLSLDTSGAPFDIVSAAWGEDASVAYVNNLVATTKPVIIKGSTNGLLNLISGETALRPATFYAVEEQKAKGAPIKWVPMDPVIVDQTAWWLTAKNEHPNAARLFVAWQTTPEAQEIAKKAFRSNVLTVDFPAGSKFAFPETPAQFDTVSSTAKKLGAILTGTK